MTLDLNDLINKSGYGKHIPILRKAGKWKLTSSEIIDNVIDDFEQLDHFITTAKYELKKVLEATECN